MKLQSQKHHEHKGKQYHKFWIVIPSKIVEQLGWKTGDKLELDVQNRKLTIGKD